MKKNKIDNKTERDEFRKIDDRHRHPVYVFKKEGNSFYYYGITHNKKSKGFDINNVPLYKNPNPEHTEKAYRHPLPRFAHTDRFSKPLRNWKLDPRDKKKIKKRDN